MANKLWKASSVNAFTTSLNGSITISDTTIPLTSVVGLQAPGVLVIDRVDMGGELTPTLREYISFESIVGNDLVDVTRGLANSVVQSHGSGAIVEETLSVTHWNDAVESQESSDSRIQQLESDKLMYSQSDGATITFNLLQSKIQTVTLQGNRILAVNNVATNSVFIIRLRQGASGSNSVTWWSGIKWSGGSAPSLSTTVNAVDVFGFICTGAGAYDGFFVGFDIR
jgi:hypothetical protein